MLPASNVWITASTKMFYHLHFPFPRYYFRLPRLFIPSRVPHSFPLRIPPPLFHHHTVPKIGFSRAPIGPTTRIAPPSIKINQYFYYHWERHLAEQQGQIARSCVPDIQTEVQQVQQEHKNSRSSSGHGTGGARRCPCKSCARSEKGNAVQNNI